MFKEISKGEGVTLIFLLFFPPPGLAVLLGQDRQIPTPSVVFHPSESRGCC